MPLSETTDLNKLPASVEAVGGVGNQKTAGLRDYLGFPPSGRIKRLTFCTAVLGLNSNFIWLSLLWMCFFMSWSRFWGLMSFWAMVGLSIALIAVNIRLAIQRCRDIGWTPWLLLLLPVPPLNLFFLTYLYIWPSEREEAAPRGSWQLFAASVLCLPLGFCFFVWGWYNAYLPLLPEMWAP